MQRKSFFSKSSVLETRERSFKLIKEVYKVSHNRFKHLFKHINYLAFILVLKLARFILDQDKASGQTWARKR